MDSSNWGAIFIVSQLLARVSADQVVLEDQPVLLQSGISWDWDWHSLQPGTAEDSGWTRVITRQNPKMRYLTCTTDLPLTKQPNNWLRSNLLNVSNINRVGITLEYAITQPCSSGSFCTETIDLHVIQSDTYLRADTYPNPVTNAEAYRKIGSVSRQSGGIRTETLYLPVNTGYILLAFHDEGGCKGLYSVTVSYNFCAKQTLNNSLVSLPKTVAPANDLKPLRVNGGCTENTVPLPGSLSIQCQSDGNWNESGIEGRCVCFAGTENTGGKCQDCPDGKYNMNKGGTCTLCPANSESTNNRKSCTCRKTFYRAPGESLTERCTGLPSAPRHAMVAFVNQSAVVLKWSPPENNGGRSDVYFEVECHKPCDEDDGRTCVYKPCVGEAGYIPDKKHLNATKVTVTNLFSFVNYTFVIYAKNGVSAVASSEDTKFTALSVRTNGSAPVILRVEVVKISENAVRVSWTLDRKNGVIQAYYVSYAVVGDSENVETIKTLETSVDITGLKRGKTYEFVVIAENHIGSSFPSKTMFVLGSQGSSGPDTTVLVTIIAVVSTLLVISLALLVLFVLCRRRNTPIRTQPRNQHPNDGSHPGEFSRGCDNVIFLVDPPPDTGNQNDALYVVVDERSSFELKRNEIKLGKLLGSGSFGKVFKAFMGDKIVAVKSLKETATPKDKQDMLTELRLMKRLQPHPHVVMLIGCCSCDDPLWIVLEYLPYGDLLGYLRKSRGHGDRYNTGEMAPTSKVTAKDLLSFGWMIADGMNYLAKMKVVHRDLAARNVLVGENKVCKISDFGLARGVEAEIYVRGTQARLPVKWMPPESLFRGESSTMSDVWSYGILLWEVFTIGDSPYPGIQANRMSSLLESGYRMPRPMHVCQELFSIMSECWSEKPESRPTFQWISTAIKRLQNDEKIYINLDEYKDEDYANFDMFDGH